MFDPIPATIRQALESQTVDQLKRYQKLLSNGTSKPGRKAELVADICGYLKGAELRNLWEELEELDQTAIAEAVHDPAGKFDVDRFKAKYGRLPGGYTGSGNMRFTKYESSLLSVFFHGQHLPNDLRKWLESFVPMPEDAQLDVVDSLPADLQLKDMWHTGSEKKTPLQVRHMEEIACHDLRVVLGLIEHGKLSVSDKTHQLGAGACKTLGKVLMSGDFYSDETLEAEYEGRFYESVGHIRSFAWPLLIQAAGLCDKSGKRLSLSKTGRKAMTDPPEKTLKKLWQRWMKTTLLDELRRIDSIKGQTGKGKRKLTAVAGRRQAIEFALQACSVGGWVKVDSLFRHMRATGDSFEVTRDPWPLYISDPKYGSLGYGGSHDFEILEARYALCVLFEYAATLGLIDVAYVPPQYARHDYTSLWGADDMSFLSRYDGLQYLRLTPLGAFCLGLTNEYTPAEPERRAVLRVLPNLDIIDIESGLDTGEQLLLDSYATRRSGSAWRLEQSALLAASEQGRDIGELRKFLLSRSVDALPDRVERLLGDTARRATLLQDKGRVHLIECADSELAGLIASDSRCKKYCLLAGERHLVVHAGQENRFRAEVRKLGYSLPAI